MNFEELYQDVVLDHSRNPRNFGEPPGADIHIHGDNPMCGDEISVHLHVDADGLLNPVGFTGNGCSICMASASMMTQKVRNKTSAAAEAMAMEFQTMLTAEVETQPSTELGDLRVLKTVRQFPQRVKCATLAWHALREAIASAETGTKDRSFSVEGDR